MQAKLRSMWGERLTQLVLESPANFCYDPAMNIGQRLHQLRAAKGLSQVDIEKRSGLLRCYTSRVENGHTIPSLQTLEKYAGALEIELYQLFFEGKGKPKSALSNKPTELGLEERRLVDTFKWLNKENKRLAVGMIGKLAKRSRTTARAS